MSSLSPDSDHASLFAALSYAAHGWCVIPVHCVEDGRCTCTAGTECPTPGKHPRTARGHNDGTTNHRQIIDWWRQWPDANIGVVCGAVSRNLLVLDFDMAGSYEQWAHEHADVARLAPTARTARGHHVYVRTSAITRSTRAPWGDVKGEGGFVVAPPSRHLAGSRYEWTNQIVDPPEVQTVELGLLPTAPPHCLTEVVTTTSVGETTSVNGNGESRSGHATQSAVSGALTTSVKRNERNNGSAQLSALLADESTIPLECFPAGPGQRNACLFKLARFARWGLRIAGNRHALDEVFSQWWAIAKYQVRNRSEEYNRQQFHRNVPTVTQPLSGGGILLAAARAGEAVEGNDERAESIFKYMSEHAADSAGVFFMSYRSLGVALGVSAPAARTIAFRLVASKRIAIVATGKAGPPGRPGSATRWRLCGHAKGH